MTSRGNLITETDLDLPDDTVPPDNTAIRTVQPASQDAVPVSLKAARTEAEIQCIRMALHRAEGNVSIAARLLDTDRKWLTKLMKLHGIGREDSL